MKYKEIKVKYINPVSKFMLRFANFMVFFCLIITIFFLFVTDNFIAGVIILIVLAIYVIFNKIENIEKRLEGE